MSWTSPKTWSVAEKVTAALLNTHVRDNLDAAAGANKAACRVYKSTAFSHTSSGNFLDATFDSERFDTQGLHSTSSLTNRITIPSGWAGLWMIGGEADWAANATGLRSTRLLVNNTAIIAIQSNGLRSDNINEQSVCTIYRLAVADYVTLSIYQSSGGTLAATCEFWAVWLGA